MAPAVWRGEQHATMAGISTDCVAGTSAAITLVLVSTEDTPRVHRRPPGRGRRALDFYSLDGSGSAWAARQTAGTDDAAAAIRLDSGLERLASEPRGHHRRPG